MQEHQEFVGNLDRFVKRWIEQTLPFAAAQAGVDSQALRQKISVAGSHNNTRFNGSTSSSDNWRTFNIRINMGLSALAAKIADLFVAHVGYMGDDGTPTCGGVISKLEFIDIIKEHLRSYWDGKIGMSPTSAVHTRSGFTDEHASYAAMVADGMNRFVVSHEFGHVVMRLRPSVPEQLHYFRNILTKGTAVIPGYARQLYEQTVDSWAEEFTCDRFGITLTGDYFRSIQESVMTQIFNAAELFFLLLRILEKSAVQMFGPIDVLGEHPPTEKRLEMLRLMTANMPPHVHRMGQAFEGAAATVPAHL